jgi:hypothetical protein
VALHDAISPSAHAKFSYAQAEEPKTAAKRLKRVGFRGCFELTAKRTDASAKVLTSGPRPSATPIKPQSAGILDGGQESRRLLLLTLSLAKERRPHPHKIGPLLYRHAEVC